jgi:hypothetical protein
MTLGNMRKLGLRSLAVTCERATMRPSYRLNDWNDAVLGRAFRPRMVCTSAGSSEPTPGPELARDAGQREVAKRLFTNIRPYLSATQMCLAGKLLS